jgi:predicted ArsR family transcriptional regulator
MSASTMAKQGEKTRAKVRKALGKKPKTTEEVAKRAGISRGMAASHLDFLFIQGHASKAKQGRSFVWALPEVPVIP